MVRTKTDSKLKRFLDFEPPKPTHGLAFSSKMLQKHKDIDQNSSTVWRFNVSETCLG